MCAKLVKVVQRCVADVARHPAQHVDVFLGDELTTWHLALRFPEEAPFVGGPGGNSLKAADFSLYLTLTFAVDFPARPPKLKFLSPWMNHQHLWGDRVCHSLLTDDFFDYFAERRTHGTSMWNAACALSDTEGVGGMPRYLQLLRDYLSADMDYDEEKHVKYDAESLQRDVEAQRAFRPEWLDTASRLETEQAEPEEVAPATSSTGVVSETAEAAAEAEAWGMDFFSKSPLIPGDPENHPCFDVAITQMRVPTLSTTMTSFSPESYGTGARTTDFGSRIDVFMPYPCSRQAWASAGSAIAAATLSNLAPIAQSYRLRLDSATPENERLEAILGIVGDIWRSTCIHIVKEEVFESERAMMCFVTLHFLLLFLAEENEGLRAYAASTVKEFMELIERSPPVNLKDCVPDLGRFLVRFLLLDGELALAACTPTLVRELFNRNVRWVEYDLWADPEASEEDKIEQVMANFERSQFGMKLTVFQSYYILRSKELGLDSLPALEACGGRPGPEFMRVFQQDCREIKELDNFQEFFLWLKLEKYIEANIHQMLCEAVEESEVRGYNAGVPGRQ